MVQDQTLISRNSTQLQAQMTLNVQHFKLFTKTVQRRLCVTLYMTHSQNLNLANGLMFAHAKSKPTIMLRISILFYCVVVCTFNKEI